MTTFAIRGREELLGVRLATSPLWETLAAVRTFVDERARAYHEPWHAAVQDRVRRLDLAPLLAVQPRTGYVPDFLTPPPLVPAPRLRDQLVQVGETPLDRVAAELRRCARDASTAAAARTLEQFAAEPADGLRLLVGCLHDVWRELVSPYWPRIRALLDSDLDRSSRALARGGLRRLFDELHPQIAWEDAGVVVADGHDTVVSLDARGLVLMPSAYVWRATAIVDAPWLPTIVYPVRGIAELWRRPAPPPEALARLLGATRALVLATIDRPLSTSTLAALTELSPAGVSRHVIALRDAGLLTAARRGHEVRYALTPLGRSLLRANGG